MPSSRAPVWELATTARPFLFLRRFGWGSSSSDQKRRVVEGVVRTKAHPSANDFLVNFLQEVDRQRCQRAQWRRLAFFALFLHAELASSSVGASDHCQTLLVLASLWLGFVELRPEAEGGRRGSQDQGASQRERLPRQLLAGS